MTNSEIEQENFVLTDKYVFMDKAMAILDVALKTEKNVILYGPGGHGKSELSYDFLVEKDLIPYVLTFGSGMTADRLFGGLNIPVLKDTGKIEYLVENSFMNHEYVIFEEMMDGQDHLLEQLKDILSSGYFRNGTQVFKIKTKLIIGCTNKTRAEFSKNNSLRALMERFPLELNVMWDNYTETAYKTLLEKRFGEIDPMMPFLLQEYSRNSIIISPRIALDSYEIFEVCGPDSLMFIAEFVQKPNLIKDSLKKFEATIKFKEAGANVEDLITKLTENTNRTLDNKRIFVEDYKALVQAHSKIKSFTVTDDLAATHALMVKKIADEIHNNSDRHANCVTKIAEAATKSTKQKAAIVDVVGSVAQAAETENDHHSF
jgi:MoxR domain in the MoxR-vWA-beta-propeller ternary systems